MSNRVDRRKFLGSAALASTVTGMAMAGIGSTGSPAERVVVGVMGLSRGQELAISFARQPGVEVRYVCDVDANRAEACAKMMAKTFQIAPQPIRDVRRLLDDPVVDALICAAPNHWHGPATLLACAAGKHVYVEKPCCHNPHEGELMVQAARKYNRAVQVGMQRRSGPGTIQAIEKIHAGAIGRTYLARAWYSNRRQSIGRGVPADVPANLDYDLWQGPAVRVPYVTHRIPYHWHWFWHWGNGELGNNGVHTLDLCRWGLNADYPIRTTSSGGRYHYDDDQETPDTHTVCFEFEGGRQLSWQGLSCNQHDTGFITFYGENGAMDLDSNGNHTIFDQHNKIIDKTESPSLGDIEHIQNFLDAIRNDKPFRLNAQIEEGHPSALLCHLGNIAHRTGRTLKSDPSNGHILDDDDAMRYWKREYAEGWEPHV